jgi:hypothetical protein
MVELKYNDVRLPAVDARVDRQVLNDAALVLRAADGRISVEPRLLGVTVRSVVARVVLGKACSAPCLELFGFGPADRRELIERLGLAAARTRLHPHT